MGQTSHRNWALTPMEGVGGCAILFPLCHALVGLRGTAPSRFEARVGMLLPGEGWVCRLSWAHAHATLTTVVVMVTAVLCAGTLVVDHWTSDGESRSHRDVLLLHDVWTTS
jgi:hypothetical protein